jgi:hypothetical protein
MDDPFTGYGDQAEVTEGPFFDDGNSNLNDMRGWTARNKPTQTLLVNTEAISQREKKRSLRKLVVVGVRWCDTQFDLYFCYYHSAVQISQSTLSTWKMSIALNSLISLFSTLAKSALLLSVASCISHFKWHYFANKPHALSDLQIFDDASRGRVGSTTAIVGIESESFDGVLRVYHHIRGTSNRSIHSANHFIPTALYSHEQHQRYNSDDSRL